MKLNHYIFILTLVLNSFSFGFELKSLDGDLELIPPEKALFSEIGKINSYKGIVKRINFKDSKMSMVDFYNFESKLIKVNKKYCADKVDEMFAIKDSEIIKIKSFRTFKSNKGLACEIQVVDKNENISEPMSRLIIIGFLHSQPVSFVFNVSKITDQDREEARQFWKKLR